MPLPTDEHACSVSLPTWSSVVGYEEGDVAITSAMRCGYPRFVYHPYVLQLMEEVVPKEASQDCLVFPSRGAAERCQAFLQKAVEGGVCENSAISVVDLQASSVHAVLFPAQTLAGMEAKAYWQHTGEVVSSRRAETALVAHGIEPVSITSPKTVKSTCTQAIPDVQTRLRERIAKWSGIDDTNHVFLTPSGMSAIYAALLSSQRYKREQGVAGGGRSIVFGFPYLDTLKMCSRTEFCQGVEFFGFGDEQDLDSLEQVLQQHSFCAVFTEVPSNPLLKCPDLYKLRELTNQYDACLVVDDTISNFLNTNILQEGLADAVCTSLTKLVSGRGDAMAGSVVANPKTERGRWMQQDLMKHHDPCLFDADATAIYINSTDFCERNERINATAEGLADWLSTHKGVQRVYYPKTEPLYAKVQKGGFGGLMSMTLEPHMCQRTFYDALDVAKGPSLGTDFTLVCPYTLLAHYHELDFAVSYNVPPSLLRIAVGLEPLEELKAKFEAAFQTCQLYPSCDTKAQRRAYSTSCRTTPVR